MDPSARQNESLPDKLYFRVGEVSRLAGVEPYVLRFWESEFPQIRPKRTPSGQRMYRKKDVETILAIRHLLYELKFTIPGARQHLKKKASFAESEMSLGDIRSELMKIRKMLD